MEIRAYAINEIGGTAEPFLYERTLGSRDVLVKITHRSLARGDIQFIDNAWGDTRFPLVPSHEIVGIVEEAGSEVADLHTGDRVGIGYQQEACFECSFCTQGIEQLCANQKVIAVDRYGGLAEHIVVDSRFAFRLSPQLDSATSTPLLSSGLTVYAGIPRAQLPAGSRVAVLGAGGLGHLAIQFLHKRGHSVTAFSHSPRKRGLIERLGAAFADSSDLRHLTEYHGAFDFILSTLNVAFDLDAFVRMLTPQGQLCLVASPLEQLSLSGGQLNNSRRSILPPQDGFLFLDRTQFRASFAADVSADAAAFMADSQVPWGLEALNGAVSEPAWKSKPSWYLVSTEDRMIPPDAQRAMSKRAGSRVAEVKGSHAVYVSQPQAVAAIITKAAHGVALATR